MAAQLQLLKTSVQVLLAFPLVWEYLAQDVHKAGH